MCVYIHINTYVWAAGDPCTHLHQDSAAHRPCIHNVYTDGLYTKGTRAHTHRVLIREWLGEPKGRSLEYI